MTVVVAESCTAGLLGGRIANVSGSSLYFLGGIIAYANEVKTRELGVADDVLREHGAVSEATAVQMAVGVRDRFGSDFGVSVTGVAGPTGGSVDKPVGRVYVAMAFAGGCHVRRLDLCGNRTAVREESCAIALEMLLEHLQE